MIHFDDVIWWNPGGSKADDRWIKTDDLWVETDDLCVKADDPERKRTISRLTADNRIWIF